MLPNPLEKIYVGWEKVIKKQDLKVTFGDIKSECEILTLLNMHAPVFQDFTEGRSGIKSGA